MPQRKQAKQTQAITKAYEPSPVEREAIRRHSKRLKSRRPAKLKQSAAKPDDPTRVARIGIDHPDPMLGGFLIMDEIGVSDDDLFDSLILQMADLSAAMQAGHPVDNIAAGANAILGTVKSISPKDGLEAMLATQMAATHALTMQFASRLARASNIPQQDSAERAFNKLARTFATQVEALKRYRTGGTQRITVEHMNVSQGGQAIVGIMTRQGEGDR